MSELDEAVRRVLGNKIKPKEKTPDIFRNWIAFFLISAFVGQLPLLMWHEIPASNKEIIVYIIGQLSGMATTALAFYFTNKAGQDALDTKRAETTAKAFDAMKAASETVPADGVTINNDASNPVAVEEVKP